MRTDKNVPIQSMLAYLLTDTLGRVAELAFQDQICKDLTKEECGGWQDLANALVHVKDKDLTARGPFYLNDCVIYTRFGSCAGEHNTMVINNIEADAPGTGQFRAFITKLEMLLSVAGYKSLAFEAITNRKLYDMLLANGYVSNELLFAIVLPDGSPCDGAVIKHFNSTTSS